MYQFRRVFVQLNGCLLAKMVPFTDCYIPIPDEYCRNNRLKGELLNVQVNSGHSNA
jgi:hypothetical protein